MTYYLTYGGLLLARYFGGENRRSLMPVYWLLLFSLFVFSGFRYEVGCDWAGYFNNYNEFWNNDYSDAVTRRDPAHWSLIVFLHNWELPYIYLNVVTSAIFFYGLHCLARRQPNPLAVLVLAFPILIINMPMSGIRQGAAVGILCIAIMAFNDRKLLRYVIIILIGSLFHASILVFLLMAPYIYGQFSSRNVIFSSVMALPIFFVLLTGEAAEIASTRYIDTGIDSAGAIFRLALLSLTGLAFLRYLAPAWRVMFPKDYKLVAIGAWVMTLLFGLVFVSSVIGDRFGYYLIPIQLIIFARIPNMVRGKNRHLLISLPYIGLTVTFLVWTQISTHFQQCYIPYQI